MAAENAEIPVVYAVTAVGVGIDTEVYLKGSEEEAVALAMSLIGEFGIHERETMCRNCWKGFSDTAKCDVEIEVHEVPNFMR